MPSRQTIQRLLAGAIARERQLARSLVPDRQREHAVELVDRAIAELLEEMHDDFGVGVRSELVAARDQALPDLAIVVDLAVEDQLHGAVLVADRLVGGGAQIDDAEAAEAEAGLAASGDTYTAS